MTHIGKALLILLCIAVISGGIFFIREWSIQTTGIIDLSIPQAPNEQAVVHGKDGLVEVGLNVSGTVLGVTVTPREIVEDSRWPSDVQCIQAGTVRVRAILTSSFNTTEQVFLLGEPVITGGQIVTLLEVQPLKKATMPILETDYRFVFKVVNTATTYKNASADLIVVDTPPPGAVVGKEFSVKGKARGTWFFEASFPIEVVDIDGNILTTVVAQSTSDWMTENFVPFSADVILSEDYMGAATLVLKKDNPSGMPENDASMTSPIHIE